MKDQDHIKKLAQLLYTNYRQGSGHALPDFDTLNPDNSWIMEATTFLYPPPPPPVDARLLQAREIVAKEFDKLGRDISAKVARDGGADNSVGVRATFFALTQKPTRQEALAIAREAWAKELEADGFTMAASGIRGGDRDSSAAISAMIKIQEA